MPGDTLIIFPQNSVEVDNRGEDMNAIEARSNSVKQLCDLYRVVIAIAVGVAFTKIIDVSSTPVPIKVGNLPTFVAILITIIPFFHGAVRHLFATYVEDGGSSRIKNWAILVDYYILFLNGGFFVALAWTIGSTKDFLWVFTGVLALDSIWGLLAYLGFAGSNSQKAEMKWAVINFFAVAVLVVLLIAWDALIANGLTDSRMAQLIAVIAVIRSAIDYFTSIEFYCPK